MPSALIAFIVFMTAVTVTATSLQPIRRFSAQFNLYDLPGGRRIHKQPIPRIGGLAIAFGFLVAIGVSFVLPVDRFAEEIERILLMVIGATIIVATMFIDDVIGIRPWPKLGIQIGAALLVILPRLQGVGNGIVIEQFNVPFFGTVELPLTLAMGFTLFWIVGMMNVINWSDGLDGLAASITLVATSVLFIHTYFFPSGNPQFTISLLAAALAGALIGFLPFNWFPARIIMGDTGSMFLGFALATISIIGGAKIATALLALWVPIVDMAWMIVYRLINRRSPMDADREHLLHRLLDSGWSQPQIVGFYAVLAALFGVAGLFLPNRELKFLALMILGIAVLVLVTWLARRHPSQLDASEPVKTIAGATQKGDPR